MALQIHRLGDINSGGGAVISIPQSTVYANNLLVAVNGSIGTSHPPCDDDNNQEHCIGNWTTANGGPNVFIQNIPVNKTGDQDTCGDSRVGGSPNVFIG